MAKHDSSARCYARLKQDCLTIGNDLFERRWQLRDGGLFAEAFLDKPSGKELFAGAAPSPSLFCDEPFQGTPVLSVSHQDGRPVGRPRLQVELRWGEARLVFDLFSASAGLRMKLVMQQCASQARAKVAATATLSGVEKDPVASAAGPQQMPDVVECFRINPLHQRLGEVTFWDRTDGHDNLVSQRTWLLGPAESELELLGNVQWIENSLTGDGLVMLKEAPLPHARPIKTQRDALVGNDGICRFFGHGFDATGGDGYPLVTLAYHGGAAGRTAALHNWQRQIRPVIEGRDGLLLSNTWGDRSRDARINEAFMREEVSAGGQLGVEVVQIDDGWQAGRSANSATAGGVWNGFWAADPNFWQPNLQRFPGGLQGIIAAARGQGMGFGLWFAPDSSGDFSNWQRDADAILQFHRQHGVRYVKIDGVKATTKLGERRLRQFFDAVLEGSAGQVVFDFDVTAEIRPGYFGLMDVGPIFVENRYTDWHRYWPHRTLRNLWMLSHYVDPVRLRMEFLNHARHADKYTGDLLAPANYEARALFAMVMIASPLGWFETSQLPPKYLSDVGSLVRLWKEYRAELHGGEILPIGSEPDGTAWCGFLSRSKQCAHLLVFRQFTDTTTHDFTSAGRAANIKVLAGSEGVEAELCGNDVRVSVPRRLGFAWVRVGF